MLRALPSPPVPTHIAARIERVTLVLRRGQRISSGEVVALLAPWRGPQPEAANDAP